MQITAGTKIEWHSQGGHLTGTVKEIKLSMSAAQTMEPWLHITDIQNVLTGVVYQSGVMLHADHSSIKMMRINIVSKVPA